MSINENKPSKMKPLNIVESDRELKKKVKNSLKTTMKELSIIEPEEEIIECPYCHSRDTHVESYRKKYPLLNCHNCQVTFFKVAYRSACTKWHKAVTFDQCKRCFFYNPQKQCQFWNGVLQPPLELSVALKTLAMDKKRPQKPVFQGRKVA